MWHSGEDVDEVARSDASRQRQVFTVTDFDVTSHDVRRRFVPAVYMRVRTTTGRQFRDVQAQLRRPGRFSGYAGQEHVPMFPLVATGRRGDENATI